jgi:hypothetical protein
VPRLEPLESRTVPYAATGNLWPHPQLITLSFQPDATDLGGQASNLLAAFNSAFGSASAWQVPILQAAQAWAQQANVNFTVVSDNGAPSGTGSYQQGDPNFGDVRIGGFDFRDNSILALAYLPPPVNNYSLAGDITFNTGQVFNVNGLDYDVYTVAVHELGHALGLDESDTSLADMYLYYQGVQSGLYADDIAGVQSIYGARVPDAYSGTTATDISSQIDPHGLTVLLTGLNIATTSTADYYKVTAPAGGTGSLALTVQSTGLSLLAPKVTVYDAGQHRIASATGNGYVGSTLSLNVAVTAGQTYYVRVTGADNSAFGTGAYGMTLNFGSGASPTIPAPNTQTANGSPLSGGGGVAERRGGGDAMAIAPGFEPRTTPGAAEPSAPGTTLPVRPAPGLSAPARAATPQAQAPGSPGAAVAVSPSASAGAAAAEAPPRPAASPVAVLRLLSEDEADAPMPEQQAPAAEWDASCDRAPIPAPEMIGACDACFRAVDEREEPAAGAAPRHDEAGARDETAEASRPAVAAALLVALGLPRDSRPEEADSRSRSLLSRWRLSRRYTSW